MFSCARPLRDRKTGADGGVEEEREGGDGGRWAGSDMAHVTSCVGEYGLCCQPGVSLMKIGIQVSCHSFSVSGARRS